VERADQNVACRDDARVVERERRPSQVGFFAVESAGERTAPCFCGNLAEGPQRERTSERERQLNPIVSKDHGLDDRAVEPRERATPPFCAHQLEAALTHENGRVVAHQVERPIETPRHIAWADGTSLILEQHRPSQRMREHAAKSIRHQSTC